jgi:hypothetical protein
MRDILTEIVKQTNGLFDEVTVYGSQTDTQLKAKDKDKTLFLQATLTMHQPQMEGEFNLVNFPWLDYCLNRATFKTDDSKFVVRRETKNSVETVTALEFKDANGRGAIYRTNLLAQENATISKDIPWNVTIVPNKSKIAEFKDLVRGYSQAADAKSFNVAVDAGDLIFGFGDPSSSSHSADMVFESGVTGTLPGGMSFDTKHFVDMMTLAGNNPITVTLTAKGVLGVQIQATHGTYNYFLRAKRV